MKRFALAGNPNSGKTTLFNSLTGSSARVGNWSGVTVDKKEGIYKFKSGKSSEQIKIIDLPGIYSLSPYTPEEVIARQFIMDEKPELVINIVDSTNLERNLYLTTQLLEMDIPVVVALNMIDLINREGSKIDAKALSEKLGIPVVPISALKTSNVDMLMKECLEYEKNTRKGFSFLSATKLGEQYEKALQLVVRHKIKHPVFHAIKLLENDAIELLHNANLSADIQTLKLEYEKGEKPFDYEAEIADLRYKFITDDIKPVAVKRLKNTAQTDTEKIDRIMTHRIWGLPIFLFFMFVIFHIIFADDLLFLKRLKITETAIPSAGIFLKNLMESFQIWLTGAVSTIFDNAQASPVAKGIIVSGLITGICSVLTFLPQLLLLLLFFSLFEDSGYMSRIAFIMDRALKRFGLSGKAFLPMLIGFGCSVPAMTGTRILDNTKEKRLTLMLIPFFSCGAKIGIWIVITSAIFPHNSEFVVLLIYLIGIFVAIFSALLLKKTVFKGIESNFVFELPIYRLPRLKNTLWQLWDKLKGFVIQVTTIIALATVVIWVLRNFNFSFQMVDTEADASSILGVLGNTIKCIFVPLGFVDAADGWKLVIAILTGLIAREAVVSTMGVLFVTGFVSGVANENTDLANALINLQIFTPATAMSFMIFNLLSTPCAAAIATAFTEFKSKKWTLFAVIFWFVMAWLVSFIVYRTMLLFSIINPADAAAILIVFAIIVVAVLGRKKRKNKCAGCNKFDECMKRE